MLKSLFDSKEKIEGVEVIDLQNPFAPILNPKTKGSQVLYTNLEPQTP